MAEANPTNLSDEDPTKMCDPCSFRGVKTLAGTYCQVCSEYLCHTCEEYHRSSKASRDHELNPLEESQRLSIKQKALISLIMACDIHRTETLTLFCVCHDVPICSACKSAKHRKCNTVNLKQFSNNTKRKHDVFKCAEKAKVLSSELKEMKDSRGKDENVVHDCSRKCIEEVMKIKHQIVDWAEKLAKEMKNEIVNKQNQYLAEMEGDIEAVVEINKQMQQIVDSFETLGQAIEDATFVLMMKEKVNIEDCNEMKEDILKQRKSITLEFQQSEKLETVMSEITSIGKLKVNEKQISKPEHQFCFQDLSSTATMKVIDAGTNCVTGCAFFPDGELAVCDYYNKCVKILTNDFTLKNELSIGSNVFDVVVVSKTEIIVTVPYTNSLQILNVSDNIMKGKSIPLGIRCWAIDCKHDNLYVSCHDNNGKGGMVKVLTMDGVTVNTFNVNEGYPNYFAVNSSVDRILVSTVHFGVFCIDKTGNPMYTYSDSQLGRDRGLLFDSYDNFMVCGEGTHNIHVVKSDGTRHRIILTGDDGVNRPRCLAYRPSDNTLVVGQWTSRKPLLAFSIQ